MKPGQNPNDDHQAPPALPADWEPDLHAVDRQIESLATRSTAPAGLTDRVFEASVGQLTAPILFEQPRRLARMARSYAALAAMLALAFVIGRSFLGRHIEAPGPAIVLASEISWLADEPMAPVDHEVAFLLDVGGLHSMDDVTRELEAIVDGAGM